MKLLQTLLKVPYFEKYCPLNKKVPADCLLYKLCEMKGEARRGTILL